MYCPNCGNDDVKAKLSGRNCCTSACDQCGCQCTIVETDDQAGEVSVAGGLGDKDGDKELKDENASAPKIRIIISVSGGAVQDVFCSTAEAEVTTVDWDAQCCGTTHRGYVIVPDMFGATRPAIVSSCIAEPMRALSGTLIQLALEQAVMPHSAARSNHVPDSNRVGSNDDSRCDCERPSYFFSGVPGIIARIENGRLAQGAAVERCDACERFPSDEAAQEKLRALGMA